MAKATPSTFATTDAIPVDDLAAEALIRELDEAGAEGWQTEPSGLRWRRFDPSKVSFSQIGARRDPTPVKPEPVRASRSRRTSNPLLADARRRALAAEVASQTDVRTRIMLATSAARDVATRLNNKPGFILAAGDAIAARIRRKAREATKNHIEYVLAARVRLAEWSPGGGGAVPVTAQEFAKQQVAAIRAGADSATVQRLALEPPKGAMRAAAESVLIEKTLRETQ